MPNMMRKFVRRFRKAARRCIALVRSPVRQLRGLRDTCRYLRLDVTLVDGRERHRGLPLRILCVGRVEQARYLLDAALESGYGERKLGRLGLWNLARDVRRNSADCDLALINMPPTVGGLLPLGYQFAIPNWIVGDVDLQEIGSEKPNRSLASDLARIRRNGIEPEIVHDLEQLDDFYHNMHVPLLLDSHGSLAKLSTYESVKDQFGECELLLVKQGGDAIAGGLITRSGKHPRLWKLGVRPPLEEHLRLGAASAVYHFVFQRLASQGHRLVNVGLSRPLLEDGVLRYKRKWNIRVRGVSGGWSLLSILKMNSATQAFLTHNPFIHSAGEGLQGAVFVGHDERVDSKRLKSLASRYCTDGLRKTVLNRIGNSDPDAPAARDVVVSAEAYELDRNSGSATSQSSMSRPSIRGKSARYLKTRVNASAEVLVDDLFSLNAGDVLLLCIDEKSDLSVIAAIQEVVVSRGAVCDVLELKQEWNLTMAADRIVDAVRSTSCQAICELTEKTYYQSRAWRDAVAAGARVYSLAGLDAPSFVRCVGMVDHHRMYEDGIKYRRVLRGAKTLRIRSAAGTDLTMSLRAGVGPRFIRKLTGGRGTRIWQPAGLLGDTARSSFLGGQLSFRPDEGSLEGTAVIDGYLWPPGECGKISEQVRWRFEKSRLVAIEGPPLIERAVRKHLGERQALVEHLCLGYHPAAGMDGSVIEAERVSGCLTIGIGVRENHTDGVMKAVLIEADGKPLHGFGQPAVSVES